MLIGWGKNNIKERKKVKTLPVIKSKSPYMELNRIRIMNYLKTVPDLEMPDISMADIYSRMIDTREEIRSFYFKELEAVMFKTYIPGCCFLFVVGSERLYRVCLKEEKLDYECLFDTHIGDNYFGYLVGKNRRLRDYYLMYFVYDINQFITVAIKKEKEVNHMNNSHISKRYTPKTRLLEYELVIHRDNISHGKKTNKYYIYQFLVSVKEAEEFDKYAKENHLTIKNLEDGKREWINFKKYKEEKEKKNNEKKNN